jgi:hypothetical protein
LFVQRKIEDVHRLDVFCALAHYSTPGDFLLFLLEPLSEFHEGQDPTTVGTVFDLNVSARRPLVEYLQVFHRNHQDRNRLVLGEFGRLATRRHEVPIVFEGAIRRLVANEMEINESLAVTANARCNRTAPR